MFKQREKLYRLLLRGSIDKIKKKLEKNPELIIEDPDNNIPPPVIAAIHQSFNQQNAPATLDLLRQYKADFNAEYFVGTWFRLAVNCSLNPLAWLLLNGGDSRLIQKLIDCGTDSNHPSVSMIINLIRDHNTDQALDYASPHNNNPYDCSPVGLVMGMMR